MSSPEAERQRRGVGGEHVARLRRAVLLGARLGASAGAGEGRRGAVRVGVERRGASAAVRRALRLARVALPRMPPGPRRAVSLDPTSSFRAPLGLDSAALLLAWACRGGGFYLCSFCVTCRVRLLLL